ncbi:MAG: DUF4386 family protein [Alphaproteobacteria bacterium]|nr:DUF4386 family protein [Alphaproteobacteria bacterium]
MTSSPARVAGLCALALVFLGPVALMLVPQQTLVPGDLAATAALQTREAGLVGVGVVAELGIVLIELVLTVALWAVFRERQPLGAALVGVSRLAMTLGQATAAVLGLGALLAFQQGLIDAAGGLLAAKAASALVWKAIFGLHCGALAVVMLRDADIPKLLGGLMALTAAGYVAVSVGGILAPQLEPVWTSGPLALVMMGEVAFFLWMLAGRLDARRAATRAA